MNRRNRRQEKNKRSRSQKAGKQKSRKNSSLPTNQRTHLRNESEYSSKRFLGEYSDKGISGQYLRPNIHPIYHFSIQKGWKRKFDSDFASARSNNLVFNQFIFCTNQRAATNERDKIKAVKAAEGI